MSTSASGSAPSPSIADLISLRGKVAIVTGAAQGIGLASAQRLAEAGAAVFLGDINGSAAEKAAAEITSRGGKAIGGVLDVSDRDAVVRMVADVRARLGPIDILVNNAGIYPPAMLPDIDIDTWHRVVRINLDGVLFCSQAAARAMIEDSRKGVIVNLTSVGGSRATRPAMSMYVATKHGVEGMTKSFAVDLGPQGIRVMSVAPTAVATPGFRDMVTNAGGGDDQVADIAASLPLRRIATPDDVARAVLFCASDLSSLVTGTTIYVDAGMMAL